MSYAKTSNWHWRKQVEVAMGSENLSINLSLVSHTNVGKTTLARTLLKKDIGEIGDRPHVTALPEPHLLIGDLKSDSLILNTIHDEKSTSESFDSDVLFMLGCRFIVRCSRLDSSAHPPCVPRTSGLTFSVFLRSE